MPDETDLTPEPPPPEQPTLIGGLAPDEMFARGMQSVKMTSGAQGTWHPPPIEEANRLFPNYTVLGLLGRGGMGAVYKAKQTTLDRLVAIKLLPLEVSVDKDFADRFVREARAMAKLDHSNIIAVYDFGTTTEGHLYFVMAYVEGANLADIIHQVGLDGGQALSIVEQVCTALAYAHGKGIVHRDIKPANVMVDMEGHVKVADFGLARLTDPSAEQMGHTMTGTVMGTPDYMAPEQMKGMNVDHRADIYSLGVMVYEMLCKEVPRGIFHPPSRRTGCDTRIDQIVIKAMQQAPDDRYQSTQEMKVDVVAARTPLPAAPAPRIPGAGPLKPPRVVVRPGVPQKPPQPLAAGPKLPSTPSPETAVMQAIAPPGSTKSKTPFYAGLAATVAVLAVVAFFLFKPKEEKLTQAQIYARNHTGESGPGVPPATTAKTMGGTPMPLSATKDAPFVNTLGMKFVPVPIGSGPSAGQTVLFSIWDTRVQDYAAYAGAKKVDALWTTQQKDGVPTGRELNHPVVGVSWEDAQAFCQWLTAKEIAEGKLPRGMKYRLPTDEEWSWAAGLPAEPGATPAEKSGKNSVDFPWGKDYPPRTTVGNYADEAFHAKFPPNENAKEDWNKNRWMEGYTDGFATTSPVGSFPANGYGLYDIGGNVYQWCEDWLDASHKDRVVRGSSWGNYDRLYLLSSYRYHYVPTYRNIHGGFRCVVGVSAPEQSGPGVPPATTANTAGGTTVPLFATKDAPFENTLWMKFRPVPILGGPTGGQKVLFSEWDTRVAEYEVFVKETKREWPKVDFEQGPTHPAVNVSWDDAQLFCQWLTAHERAAGRLPGGWSYRLPSDHEWSCAVGLDGEDAAKLPSEKNQKISDIFPWGQQWPPPEKAGNYASEELQPFLAAGKYPSIKDVIPGYHDGYATTAPVGSYAANRFGLFDMGGNAQQWCQDWYDKDQKDRVLRGASWGNYDRGYLLSSSRRYYAPTTRGNYYGFRCVLAVSAPPAAGAADTGGMRSVASPTSVGEGGEKSGH